MKINTAPILRCQSFKTCGMVKHHFVEERKVEAGKQHLGYELIYACSGCETHRRWGYTTYAVTYGLNRNQYA